MGRWRNEWLFVAQFNKAVLDFVGSIVTRREQADDDSLGLVSFGAHVASTQSSDVKRFLIR